VLKVYKKHKMKPVEINRAYFERQILSRVNHDKILGLIAFFDDEDYMIFVSEKKICDLRDLIDSADFVISEKTIKIIFHQMVKAVMYLHKQNIIHRDIKVENVLVGNTIYDISLIDFGLATTLEHLKVGEKCGTIISAAPEMLNNE